MNAKRRQRAGGRAARQAMRTARVIEQQPFLTRALAPTEVLSQEGLELIEHNADTLLEQVGIEMMNFPEALSIYAGAGADVDGTRVRFPRGMCREIITRSAPSSFVQHARNPARSVTIGNPYTVFAPAYGSPFVRDADNGRRYATIEDFRNFAKLTYMSPALHHGGGNSVRAGGPTGQQAALRHALHPCRVPRQAVHVFGHPTRKGTGFR